MASLSISRTANTVLLPFPRSSVGAGSFSMVEAVVQDTLRLYRAVEHEFRGLDCGELGVH